MTKEARIRVNNTNDYSLIYDWPLHVNMHYILLRCNLVLLGLHKH